MGVGYELRIKVILEMPKNSRGVGAGVNQELKLKRTKKK